jgi:CRISPR-associated protein Cmr2
MTTYVLLLSLGPVQDFIASARRCRDLWYGSWLLSDLAKAVACGIADEAAPDDVTCLVFPGAAARASLEKRDTSVANRILARVQGSESDVRRMAGAGKRAMLDRLHYIRDDAFGRVGRDDPKRAQHFHEATANSQVDDLIELHWVAVPETAGYAAARKEAERLMSARKNTRTWGQPPWAGAGVPKSSLDGTRESVLDESLYPQPLQGGRRRASMSSEQRRVQYGVHGSERLCGPGLLKRHGRALGFEGASTERFLSTSHMAALSWMVGVETDAADRRDTVEKAWRELRSRLRDVGVDADFTTGVKPRPSFFGKGDGACLFQGRLRDVLEDAEVKEAVAVEQAWSHVIRAAGRGEPIPYYAILLADGDRMGAVIDAQADPEQHRKLSLELAQFATEAKQIVESKDGIAIYAGGDDVLALLPLHTALPCAQDLARCFAGVMAPWSTGDGQKASLSAGLVFVHHLMPLDAALSAARQAERVAKERAGRNALSLTVLKRGGAPVNVSGSWDTLVPRLESLGRLRRLDAISDRAGYELASLDRLVPRPGAPEEATLSRARTSEAIRILKRKRAERGMQPLEEQHRKQLEQRIRDENVSPGDLGRALYVATMMARASSQAGVEVT